MTVVEDGFFSVRLSDRREKMTSSGLLTPDTSQSENQGASMTVIEKSLTSRASIAKSQMQNVIM